MALALPLPLPLPLPLAGGVIAQYRTVLTAAAMTPWMDRNVSWG